KMSYFKIIEKQKILDSIINTEENFDFQRIQRFNNLNQLLELLFKASKSYNLSLHYILSQIYPNIFQPECDIRNEPNILQDIDKIRKEIFLVNFEVYTEFKYFNDFVLNLVRKNLATSNIIVPDRFKSHYFFEKIEDCKKYLKELRNYKPCEIVEVEIIEKNQLIKVDNTLLTTFQNHYTSCDFYNQAKECLTGKISLNPLYEIVFQGKYRITKNIRCY